MLIKVSPQVEKGLKVQEALKKAVEKFGKALDSSILNDLQAFVTKAFSGSLSAKDYFYFSLPGMNLAKVKTAFINELKNNNLAQDFLKFIDLKIKGNQLFFYAKPKEAASLPAQNIEKNPLPSLQGVTNKAKVMEIAIEAGARAAGIDTRSVTWQNELEKFMDGYKEYSKAMSKSEPAGSMDFEFLRSESRKPVDLFLKAFSEKLKEAKMEKSLLGVGGGVKVIRKFPWFVAKLELPSLKGILSFKKG